MKFLYLTMILLCLMCSHWGRAQERVAKPFVVHHFPRAAYLKERTTFVLSGSPDTNVSVKLGDKEIATSTLSDKMLELNLALNEPGTLTFSCGKTSHTFDVISPATEAELQIVDGFLRTKTAPAILLVSHRHPPKHDRTWETVKVLGTLLGNDYRPKATSAAVLGLDYLERDARANLDSSFWTQKVPPRKSDLNPLAGLILAVADLKPVDVLVLAPGIPDLELGMTPLQYRMHVEWLLQRVDRKQFPHLFLVLPDMSADQRKCFPETRDNMRLAAMGNEAIFIERDTRQEKNKKEWGGEIRNRMRKYLVIK